MTGGRRVRSEPSDGQGRRGEPSPAAPSPIRKDGGSPGSEVLYDTWRREAEALLRELRQAISERDEALERVNDLEGALRNLESWQAHPGSFAWDDYHPQHQQAITAARAVLSRQVSA